MVLTGLMTCSLAGDSFLQPEEATKVTHTKATISKDFVFIPVDYLIQFNSIQFLISCKGILAKNKSKYHLGVMAKIHGKPTMNGEPNYEDHCVGSESDCSRRTFNAHVVR
jgi:hypothetical protein